MSKRNVYLSLLFIVIAIGFALNLTARMTYCVGGAQKFEAGFEYGAPISFVKSTQVVNLQTLTLVKFEKKHVIPDVTHTVDQNRMFFFVGRFVFCFTWWAGLAHLIASIIIFESGKLSINISVLNLLLSHLIVASFIIAKTL